EGVLVTNAAGERVYANAEAARLVGYASAEALASAAPEETRMRLELFGARCDPLPLSGLPTARALGGSDPEPMPERFRSGRAAPERVSEVRAVAVRDEDVVLRYVISFFREVTDEVAREEEQRAAADEYATLYRQSERTTALLDALYGAAPVGLG